MKRKLVQVGVIGLGKAWESDYRPALLKMRDRIEVSAVNDCIPARANQVAAHSEIYAIHSLAMLAKLPQLQALLLLESGWRGSALLSLALQNKKSIFLVEPLGNDLPLINQTRQTAEANDLSVVPELTLRYTPASCRLQELLATALGEVTTVQIEATLPAHIQNPKSESDAEAQLLVHLFDWCQRILGRSPSQLFARKSTKRLAESGSNHSIKIKYPATNKTQKEVTVLITLRSAEIEAEQIHYKINCEQGEVSINSATDISWHITGEKTTHETLLSERTSTEVMLDHFCRRIVGGLIPVADLDDIARSVKLVQLAEQSSIEKRAIDV